MASFNQKIMRDYFITYNDTKTVTVTDIDAAHARETIKKVIPNVNKINSTFPIPKLKKKKATKNKNRR